MALWAGQVNYDKSQGLIQLGRQHVEMNVLGKIACSLKGGAFYYFKTRDRRKCSLFTVERCSPKTNRVISPTVKYAEKTGPGKSVH